MDTYKDIDQAATQGLGPLKPTGKGSFVPSTTDGGITSNPQPNTLVPQPQDQVCPTCGRCPTCGHTPVAPRPYPHRYWDRPWNPYRYQEITC